MSEVLFLFDLDQCLPLTNIGLTSENLEFLMARLRRACLRILLNHSSENISSTNKIETNVFIEKVCEATEPLT